jgi:hypothetical protein
LWARDKQGNSRCPLPATKPNRSQELRSSLVRNAVETSSVNRDL